VRNQRFTSLNEPPAQIWWIRAGSGAHPYQPGGGTPGRSFVADPEAMGKVCGVPMAMPQGHSWAPNPSIDDK